MTLVCIGGGAAGFFGAINAALLSPGSKVMILEKTGKLLAKVRVSGGGRCNVTHHCFDPEVLSTFYPRGNKELLGPFRQFSVQQTIDWFNERNVTLKAEDDGRMFPASNSSETIVNCFLREAERLGIEIRTGTTVKSITPHNGTFTLLLGSGEELQAQRVLVATGGSNNQESYQWLQALGHKIVTPIPSLFTFNIPNKNLTTLMGVSVPNATVNIKESKLVQNGPLLITHWGLSGPAILKLSAWGAKELNDKQYAFNISVNWLGPKATTATLLNGWESIKKNAGSKTIDKIKPTTLPSRLWQYLLDKASIVPTAQIANVNKQQLLTLATIVTADTYSVNGKSTFKEEFVTCGGIDLKEVNFKTMESKLVPHLHFAGEVLNIDAITGGFNFQAAWTTSWIAAQAITST